VKLRDISQNVEELVTRPGAQLSRGARFLQFQYELWKFCARRLHRNNLMAMSAALSFRTIFAMIPILVFGFLVLKSIGVVEDGKRSLQEVLERSGLAQIAVPTETDIAGDAEADGAENEGAVKESDAESGGEERGEITNEDGTAEDDADTGLSVAELIEELVVETEQKLTVRRIGPVGGVLLIWTALTLLMTVEQCLNRIFGADRSRVVTRRILLYWSMLTLGPVAITVVSYGSRVVMDTFQDMAGIAWLTAAIGWLAPILVSMLVIAMVYKLIPNTTVGFAAAFGGAFVTVPLWLITRWAFAIYVERFVLKGNLYGFLGVLPLFMLWLNLSWTVFLFGAELANTAANLKQFQRMERAQRRVLGPSDWLAVMVAIGKSFVQGRGPATLDDIVNQTDLAPESAAQLLTGLIRAELVCVTDDEDSPGYMVARPPEQLDLATIFDLADPPYRPGAGDANAIAATVAQSVGRARDVLRAETLHDLIQQDESPGGRLVDGEGIEPVSAAGPGQN
jgi:membrane protein